MFKPDVSRPGRVVSKTTGVALVSLALASCANYNDAPFTGEASAQPPAATGNTCLTGVDYVGDRSRKITEYGQAMLALAKAGANGAEMNDGRVEFVLACGGSEWGDFSTALREMRGEVTDRDSRNGICANNFYPANITTLQGRSYADEHTTRDIRNRLANGGDAATLCEAQIERAMEADRTAFWLAVPSDHDLWRATGTQPAP